MRQIFILTVFITVLSGFSVLSAQTDTNTYHIRDYGIKLNRTYFIVTMDNEIKKCEFIAVNTYDVLIKESGESETEVMQKTDIKTITTEYPKTSSLATYKPIQFISTRWCIGGGAVLNSYSKAFTRGYEIGSNEYDAAGKYSFGYQFFVHYTAVTGSLIALRADLDYQHEFSQDIENNNSIYYPSGSYSLTTGGSFDQFSFKLMLGVGNFVPRNDITVNFFLGIGAGIRHTQEMTFYSRTTYYGEETIKRFSETQFTILASSSLLVGYQAWDKAGLFIEPQVNLWGIKRMPVQLSLRTGIMF